MTYPSGISTSGLAHTQTAQQVYEWEHPGSADRAAHAGEDFESTELGVGPSPDSAYESLLIQMRYDEHVAHQALRMLFESGALECLGG
jgi:hypothetical protein